MRSWNKISEQINQANESERTALIENLPLEFTDGIYTLPGHIYFDSYGKYKDMVVQISDWLKQTEVTEENLTTNRKLVARVRKACNELDDKRKEIKRSLLNPYSEFELQVKELISLAKEGEDIVREQIRELDERQREEKEREIERIFNLRLRHYNFPIETDYTDFLENRHLNKSTPLSKVEQEMVTWLETRKTDCEALRAAFESTDKYEQALDMYAHKLNPLSILAQMGNEEPVTKKEREQVLGTDYITYRIPKRFEATADEALRACGIEFSKN